jgi:hypothetical protein
MLICLVQAAASCGPFPSAVAVQCSNQACTCCCLPLWLLQLQEELSRSRNVSRQLRLKLKACEQELSDAQAREQQLKAAAAAAGPASGSRRSNGRVGGPYNAASGWSRGSSYLGGGPGPGSSSSRQYNKFPAKGSGRAAAGGSTAASSRG